MWYDARKNAYTVVEHNLDVGYQKILEKHRSQGLPAYLFEHKKHHHAKDADDCRSCDRIVRRNISRRPYANLRERVRDGERRRPDPWHRC